jgi:hypothetical protein
MARSWRVRRGTAAEWTAADPVLGNGEFGLATDTRELKLGDGTTAWSSLTGFDIAGTYVETGELVVNVKDYGAVLDGVTDDSAAVQAAANAARDLGSTLYLPPGTCRLAGLVDVYTSMRCDGEFVISAGVDAALRFQRVSAPVTLTATALGGLTAGSSTVTGLSGQVGTLLVQSTEHMIERNNGVGDFYAKEEASEVVKDDGTVSPPIALTYSDLNTVTATLYPPEKTVVVDGLRVRVDGSTVSNTGGFVRIYRGGTFNDLRVLNETGLDVTQGVVISKATGVTFNRAKVDGFQMSGAGYGIASYHTAFTAYNDCTITDCRHTITGRWNKARRVTGGVYENGLDDHWVWDMSVEGIQSIVPSGKSHIQVAGRDLRVRDCVFVGGRNILGVRADTPELAGEMSLERCSWKPSAGQAALWMVGYSTTSLAFFDYGRTVQSPSKVRIRDIDYTSPGDTALSVLRTDGAAFPHTYWRDVEIARARVDALGVFAYRADKDSANHPDDTTGPTVVLRDMDFSAAAFDNVYILDTGEVADGKGFRLLVENCKAIGIKIPDSTGMAEVTVRESRVRAVLQAVASAGSFSGDYRFEECVFDAPTFSGKWVAAFRQNVWSGAASSSTISMTARTKAWLGNLIVYGATGLPAVFDGYAGSAHYATPHRVTATLNFGTIADGGKEDLTVAVPGAVVGDPVALAPPTILPAGFIPYAYVSAAGTVTVRLTNVSGAAADPGGGQSYTVRVF